MGTARAAVAASDDEGDHAEQHEDGDEDHRGNRLEAETGDVLVSQGGDLLGRSCVVPQLIHLFVSVSATGRSGESVCQWKGGPFCPPHEIYDDVPPNADTREGGLSPPLRGVSSQMPTLERG